MIRIHIHRFVDIHNNHPIWKQAKRDHYLPTDKPFEMYFYPESEKNYTRTADETILQKLETEVKSYVLDDFLPLATIQVFQLFLLSGNFPIQFSDQDSHKQTYVYLRRQVWEYVANGGEAQIFNQLIGAEDWIFQDQLEKEILQHADILVGDMEILITETDEENENKLVHVEDSAGIDEETTEDVSEDDDHLILNIGEA